MNSGRMRQSDDWLLYLQHLGTELSRPTVISEDISRIAKYIQCILTAKTTRVVSLFTFDQHGLIVKHEAMSMMGRLLDHQP